MADLEQMRIEAFEARLQVRSALLEAAGLGPFGWPFSAAEIMELELRAQVLRAIRQRVQDLAEGLLQAYPDKPQVGEAAWAWRDQMTAEVFGIDVDFLNRLMDDDLGGLDLGWLIRIAFTGGIQVRLVVG